MLVMGVVKALSNDERIVGVSCRSRDKAIRVT